MLKPLAPNVPAETGPNRVQFVEEACRLMPPPPPGPGRDRRAAAGARAHPDRHRIGQEVALGEARSQFGPGGGMRALIAQRLPATP